MDWLTFVDLIVIFLLFFSKLLVKFSLSIKQQIVNKLTNYIAEFVIIIITLQYTLLLPFIYL